MGRLLYYWNKLNRKIRGKAIRNSVVDKRSKIEAGSLFLNSKMSRYSFCGYDCKIINCDIGAFCSIADGVVIGGAQHPIEWGSTSPVFYKGKDSVTKKFSEFERPKNPRTIIGNDVWIGERAIIKGGITIGDGAVVGMGSIVTHDVPPFCIVAGNPARIIRKRFDDKSIEIFKQKQWWNRSDNEIKIAAEKIRTAEEYIGEFK